MALNEMICALFFIATLSTSFHMSHELVIGSPYSKDSYSNLLNKIVNINRQRLSTMKKLSELQDYNLPRGFLKTRDEDGYFTSSIFVNEDSRPDYRNKKKYIFESENDGIEDKGINGENYRTESGKENIEGDVGNIFLTKDQVKMLRVDWNYPCHAKGNKKCKRACRRVVEKTCEEYYSCDEGFEDKMKKYCRKVCLEKFLLVDYDRYIDSKLI